MRHKPHDGSAWIVGLLLASLVLVAVLAWQALDSAGSHRNAAEAVLRDYAQLAADEFVRRTVSEVGYYGYYRVLTTLSRWNAEQGSLPGRQALIEADAQTERALSLVRYLFRFDLSSGRLDTAGGPAPGDAVTAWMRRELEIPERAAGERPMGARNVDIDGNLHSFVYLVSAEPPLFLGFEVELEDLETWFSRSLETGSLLPPSLGKGGNDLDYLALTVRDREYREVFRAAPPGAAESLDPYLLSASAPYGDAYEGIFQGLTVRVTLQPEAASRLVIGGLPRSRLPILLGLLVLTVGLLLAAIFQLRRARALGQLRSDFVSQVSHELRTPLTQIRMFAETLLLGRVRSEDEGRRSLEIVDQEARRLSHLVENILQFSRGERGTIRLSPEPRELTPLVRDLVRDFAPLVGRRKVTFAIHPAADAEAVVDEDALRQILLNLLDNAVKYGPSEQQVVIGLERGGDGWVRLWVDDEGPGIPPPERRRIWQSFQRLERDRRSAVAGTGIGLAVVRDLVALQGGNIRVEEGDRGGARFVVELPLHDSGRAAETAEPEEVPA